MPTWIGALWTEVAAFAAAITDLVVSVVVATRLLVLVLLAIAALSYGWSQIPDTALKLDASPAVLVGALAVAVAALLGYLVAGVARQSVAVQFASDYDFDEVGLANALGNGATAPPTPESIFDRIKSFLDVSQSRIAGEYSDIASRTGWLMTAQSFLFGVFVATVSSSITQPSNRYLATSIAAIGVLSSLVLMSAIFFGHALTNRLKAARDAAEIALHQKFRIPRTGAGGSTEVHRWGHFATKALTSLAFTTWVLLANAAIYGIDRTSTEAAPYVVIEHLLKRSGPAYLQFKAPPPFARGAPTYGDIGQPDQCSTRAEAIEYANAAPRLAEEWKTAFFEHWSRRGQASNDATIVLVGSADRMPLLSEQLRQQYDSNSGLARARAETIKNLLTKGSTPSGVDALDESRVLVLITGPRHTKVGPLDCRDAAEDRRVQVFVVAPQ